MASPSSTAAIVYAGGLFFSYFLYRFVQNRRENPRGLPLPPGPKGHFIIGNLFDFPAHKPWLVFEQWSRQYGDMVYFEIFGQPFIILGTSQRTWDLFEKRSSNYSSRVRQPMLNEVMDWSWNFGFMIYGTFWRRHRRVFHDHFHPNMIHKYHSIQTTTARKFTYQLLREPDDFVQHIRRAFASNILKVVYGMDTPEKEDAYVKNAEIVLSGLADAGLPGKYLVDVFPWMKLIPEWFPGAGWKRKAAWYRYHNEKFVNEPWNQVKREMKDGTAKPSVARALYQDLPHEDSDDRAEAELVARNVCAIAFAGGSDTTVSAVQIFLMAMVLYPEVQRKAQAELDKYLDGRLPEYSDRPHLPYMNALVKESTRWQLIAPLGAAHMAVDADQYNGYYIPKGAILLGNSWAILHDTEAYPEPMDYNPDRFLKDGKLDPSVQDPSVAFFGYGRRICPGRFFSYDSMFITFAHVLAVFDIRASLDKEGREIKLSPEMTSGFVSHPERFTCRITPRSSYAEKLIRQYALID